jgi:hypothetical protein
MDTLITMSSVPLATIFYGDVNVFQGSDVSQFGYGDININRKCIILGTENSTSNTDGALVVSGGIGVTKTANFHENVNALYGITNLTETHIDTTNGPFTVTGGNAINMQVGPASQFVSTSGNISVISTTQSAQMYGGLNSGLAVDIKATDPAGGVHIMSGSGVGEVQLVSGAGGIHGTTSLGNITLTANGGSGGFVVNGNTDNQNLTFALNGGMDSQINILSSGNNTTRSAINMQTTNSQGNITIANMQGLGQGAIAILAGGGGFSTLTNTGGSISMVSQGAPSEYLVDSSGNNQNLTIGLNNPSNSSVVIQSAGTSSAIRLESTFTTGNIEIVQPELSQGKVDILTGIGGFSTTTRTGGSLLMNANGATSTYTNTTTADNQHLYINVTGDTDSRVIISSSGINNQAITLATTNASGGILLNANGLVQLESQSVADGVRIATSNTGVPVYIGTPSSTTTVYGDLNVRGVTTTINSTVVTVDDNILVLNNAPSGTSDGGLAIKRYQNANDVGTGDVVIDTPEESGTCQNSGNSTTTIQLDMTASNTNDFYKGWWIKITSGTGANQVRRIKAYDGSTKIASIFSSADQTTSNVVPVEGMDFSTILDGTSTYSLYPCHYVMNIWDESNNEFALVCSGTDPADAVSIAHYADLHVNDLTANALIANTINGSLADITSSVILNNSSSVPVTMSGFPNNYGIYLVFIKPATDTLRAHAIFMIGRVDAPSIPGTVIRTISVKGSLNDQLDMQWPANSMPQLFYRPFPNGLGGSTTYKVKIVSL